MLLTFLTQRFRTPKTVLFPGPDADTKKQVYLFISKHFSIWFIWKEIFYFQVFPWAHIESISSVCTYRRYAGTCCLAGVFVHAECSSSHTPRTFPLNVCVCVWESRICSHIKPFLETCGAQRDVEWSYYWRVFMRSVCNRSTHWTSREHLANLKAEDWTRKERVQVHYLDYTPP